MAGRWWWWRWLLVLCLLPLLVTRRSGVSAYRVTLIPLPETGHCRQMVGVGRQLLSQGHQVLLYVPSYFKIRRCTEPAPTDDIQVQVFRVDPTVAAVLDSLDSIMEAVRGGNVAARPSARPVRDVLGHVCQSYLEARDDLEGLKKFKPDLVLLDGDPSAHCLALVPAFLAVPVGLVGSDISPLDSGGPLPVNYYPSSDSALPGSMSFTQRLTNFFHTSRRLGPTPP
ncbi:hypothetical protein C0Q70_10376 [Pomacea canaliculata]|uniref:Uncharacterized protein n=1 Tax=Pomacea canaliculata TaxID=400727 RepID=A0A2T7PCF4_POMCA|nr:hypothetical protein C0Q70_10376 [Pomacea canaliculata]